MNFPEYENYFGLGGNTVNSLREIEYNWVRLENFDIRPMFRFHSTKSSSLDFGLVYQYRDVQRSDNRIAVELLDDDAFSHRSYLGANLDYQLGFVDHKVFPANGFMFAASGSHLRETSRDESVSQFELGAKFYVQLLVRPKLVFAHRTGFAKSYGERQFYHYPSIGNNHGLRGFRNERFRGDASLFFNQDIRMKLIKWNNHFIPMDIGILAGYDIGKVYYQSAAENPWHTSQSLGMWFDLLGIMVLQTSYSLNVEQNTFSVQMGFSF